MSIRSHKDTAQATVEAVRQRYADQGPKPPVRAVAERMNIETCGAILTGAGEMRDLEAATSTIALHANECLASALASLLLTFAQGDQAVAQTLVPLSLHDLQKRTTRCISEAESRGIVASTIRAEGRGRA